MRFKIVSAVFACCLIVLAVTGPVLGDKSRPATIRPQVETGSSIGLDAYLPGEGGVLRSSAQADTFVLGSWTFDTGQFCDPQGWTAIDFTDQTGCYWHIDDFTGLGGGSYGRLVPLRGNQSLWCGARVATGDYALCGYATLPGYGNGWNQGWVFRCIEVPDTEEVYIAYLASFDSEPGYDGTSVEYVTKSTCDSLQHVDQILPNDWVELGYFDDAHADSFRTDTIPAGHDGFIKIRFRFHSDGGWSDYDGLWNTDGGVILDSLTVTAQHSGLIDYEDFEDEALDETQTADGDWLCQNMSGYGSYAGLAPGLSFVQEDPCKTNTSCLWAFVFGSTETYACGGHPGQIAVPKCNEQGQCILNYVMSPKIPLTGSGATFEWQFDVYRDLPIPNLVFFHFLVRSWVDGCPMGWRQRSSTYYGANKDWFHARQWFADLISPGATHVQVALGVRDRCAVWCGVYGDGACHSHSPLFDNVKVIRINNTGPQWSVRDIELFQDTFPTNGLAVGAGRVDAAIDRAWSSSPTVYFGDSASVQCADPVDGLATDPHTGFGGAVYCYFSISPQNQPGKMRPYELEEDNFRWPLVDSVVCDGKTWYKFRCDTAFFEPDGPRTGPVQDKWCIDINDNVITNGDTLEFFFGAEGNAAITFWSQDAGTVSPMEIACAAPMEMQVLPGVGGTGPGFDILYVDGYSGGGAQPYFDSAFDIIGIYKKTDRFDKRGPSSLEANGLGEKVSNVFNQLIDIYRIIIWNSGDLSAGGAPGDGTGTPVKSDDFAALFLFLDQHTHPDGAGIYFSGDNLATQWNELTGPYALNFRAVYLPFNLVTGDHTTTHGISPLVIGEDSGIFDHGPPTEEDTLVAYGGCPVINDFDQIQPIGSSALEMTYGGTGLATDGAVVSFDSTNANGYPARVVLSGFSFHYIRDDRPLGDPDRAFHLDEILRWMGSTHAWPSPVLPTDQFANQLHQNYPNPFNPVTKINYSIKQPAHVTLKIYNVAGQLVRTLVNEEQTPRGEGYTVVWRGLSDDGEQVASGVYFYKLTAGPFTQTRKMVLLK